MLAGPFDDSNGFATGLDEEPGLPRQLSCRRMRR